MDAGETCAILYGERLPENSAEFTPSTMFLQKRSRITKMNRNANDVALLFAKDSYKIGNVNANHQSRMARVAFVSMPYLSPTTCDAWRSVIIAVTTANDRNWDHAESQLAAVSKFESQSEPADKHNIRQFDDTLDMTEDILSFWPPLYPVYGIVVCELVTMISAFEGMFADEDGAACSTIA